MELQACLNSILSSQRCGFCKTHISGDSRNFRFHILKCNGKDHVRCCWCNRHWNKGSKCQTSHVKRCTVQHIISWDLFYFINVYIFLYVKNLIFSVGILRKFLGLLGDWRGERKEVCIHFSIFVSWSFYYIYCIQEELNF